MKYLGHTVTGEGVVPDPEKVEALKNWNIPQQVEKLQEELSPVERITVRKQIAHE